MSLHLEAQKGEIAETVLLPGDPLRAKFIAETYLTEVICYNQIRNMLGFTGVYRGKRVSVQGTGMGIPSTAIYATELIRDYNVKSIIRLGTCGGLHADIQIGQTILAISASTDSNINRLKFGGMDYAPTANFELLTNAYQQAQELSIPVQVGGIFSTDQFYNGSPDRYEIWNQHGVLGAEMESSVLYTLAARENVKALSILTVSDNLVTGEATSAKEREKRVEDITRLALKII